MGALIFKNLFNPESIGIVGDFNTKNCRAYTFIKNIEKSGIKFLKFNKNDVKNLNNNKIDLLVITVPLKEIPDLLDNLSKTNIKNVLISSGKSSIDDDFYEGLIIKKLRKKNIKLLGFHSFGFISTENNLNVSLFSDIPEKGELALVSQSGALINTILDITKERGIGFSYLIDLGTLSGIDFGDAIDFLGFQENTKAILLFIENLKNPRKFLSAVRCVARVKPIIVVKAGKSEISRDIIKFHTGKLPGKDFVYDIAFRRAGAVRVNDFTELFICGDILSKKKISYGEKLCVISNSRTVNILISDILSDKRLKLQEFSDELKEKLKKYISEKSRIFNPLDLTMEATDDLIINSIKECFFSKEFQTIMVVIVLNRTIDVLKIIKEAEKLKKNYKKTKIMYICIGGNNEDRSKLKSLQTENILIFFNLFYAVNSYYYTLRYYRSLEKMIAFTPSFDKSLSYDKQSVENLISNYLEKDKKILSDSESKQILKFYGINVHETFLVSGFVEAKNIVNSIGYPVVLKIDEFIKDVKGFKYINDDDTLRLYINKLKEEINKRNINSMLNIQKMIFDIDFEFRIGIDSDIEFGPYFYLSYKGGLNRVYMLPPLNRFLAQRLIRKIEDFEKLEKKGLIDIVKLEEILVRLSHLISNHSEIYRIIIDPVILSGKEFHIVNAFIELIESKVKAPMHLSIRPYPSEYEFHEKLPDGTPVFIRPIRPEDEPMHIEFFYSMSRETQYYRFFTYTSRITHEQIAMFTHVDYDREIAIVAIINENGKDKIIGVNRLTYYPYENKYEFAIVVTDAWQGKGVSKILMEKLFYIAKDRKIKKIYGTVLAENRRMLNFVKKFGFKVIGYESEIIYIMKEL